MQNGAEEIQLLKTFRTDWRFQCIGPSGFLSLSICGSTFLLQFRDVNECFEKFRYRLA